MDSCWNSIGMRLTVKSLNVISSGLMAASAMFIIWAFIDTQSIVSSIELAGDGHESCASGYGFGDADPIRVVIGLSVAFAFLAGLAYSIGHSKLTMAVSMSGVVVGVIMIILMLINIATTECGPIGPGVNGYSNGSLPNYHSSVVNNSQTHTQIIYSDPSESKLGEKSEYRGMLIAVSFAFYIAGLIVISLTPHSRVEDEDDFRRDNDDENYIAKVVHYPGYFLGKIPFCGHMFSFWYKHWFLTLIVGVLALWSSIYMLQVTGEFGSDMSDNICTYNVLNPVDYRLPCIDIVKKEQCEFYSFDHHASALFVDSCATVTDCTCALNTSSGVVSWTTVQNAQSDGMDVICETPQQGSGGGCDFWEKIWYESSAAYLAAERSNMFHIPLSNPVISTPVICDYAGFTSGDCQNMGRTITGNYSLIVANTSESSLGNGQEGCFLLPMTDGQTVYWKLPTENITAFSGDTIGLCKSNGRSLDIYNKTSGAWQLFNNASIVGSNETNPANTSFSQEYWNTVQENSVIIKGRSSSGSQSRLKTTSFVLDDDTKTFVEASQKTTGHLTGISPTTIHQGAVTACAIRNENQGDFYSVDELSKVALAQFIVSIVFLVALFVVLMLKLTKSEWEGSCDVYFGRVFYIFYAMVYLALAIIVTVSAFQVLNLNHNIDCPRVSSGDDEQVEAVVVLQFVTLILMTLALSSKKIPSFVNDDSDKIENLIES